MKDIKRYLEKQVDELVEELKYYDVCGEEDACEKAERQISDVRSEIELLNDIQNEREGNLLKFNSDGSFRLWVVRIPEGGEQIVEHYDADISFGEVEDVLEAAPCVDVSDEFSLKEIAHLVNVSDNLLECDRTANKYYFVSNDVFEESILFCDKKPSLEAQIKATEEERENGHEPIRESLESQMFHAAMEQSAIEAEQKVKIAYKIECSGKCFRHFINDGERDSIFFSLQEAEDFCNKERGPYNRLGVELTPVEVRIPVHAKVERKEHSTYKNMRFVSSEER